MQLSSGELRAAARRVSRRRFLALTVATGSTAIMFGCGPSAAPAGGAAPTQAPAAAKPTEAPKPAAAKPTEAAKPAAEAKPTTAPAAPAAAAKPAEAGKPAAAAAPSAGGVPKPTSSDAEWIIGVTSESSCFDPSTCSTAAVATWNNRKIFEPLVTFEGADLKPVGRIAESWKQVDETTLEVMIRKGVKFHNGADLTAEDVKYSLDLNTDAASTRKIYTQDWVGSEVTGPNTIRIKTKGPSAELLTNLSQLFIVPKAGREQAGKDAFGQKPIGTGPYKFMEFVSGQRLVLEAFPDYWRGKPNPQKITLRLIADAGTRVAELKTGGVQIIASPPLTQLKELNQGDTQVVALSGARTIIYGFNTLQKPFDNVKVRQAINYAVDRESILKDVLEGNGVLTHGPWANTAWPGYDADLKPYPYDPAKAKQLLTEAGHAGGVELTLNFTSGVQLKDRDIAEVIATQLAEVGVKVRLQQTESAKLNDTWKSGAFEGINQVFWSAPSDPGPMIAYSFARGKAQQEDPKLNELVEKSRRAVDPAQRAVVLKELGQYVNDQALWLFMHAQNEFYARRRNVAWEPIPEYTYGSVLWYQLAPR